MNIVFDCWTHTSRSDTLLVFLLWSYDCNHSCILFGLPSPGLVSVRILVRQASNKRLTTSWEDSRTDIKPLHLFFSSSWSLSSSSSSSAVSFYANPPYSHLVLLLPVLPSHKMLKRRLNATALAPHSMIIPEYFPRGMIALQSPRGYPDFA